MSSSLDSYKYLLGIWGNDGSLDHKVFVHADQHPDVTDPQATAQMLLLALEENSLLHVLAEIDNWQQSLALYTVKTANGRDSASSLRPIFGNDGSSIWQHLVALINEQLSAATY